MAGAVAAVEGIIDFAETQAGQVASRADEKTAQVVAAINTAQSAFGGIYPHPSDETAARLTPIRAKRVQYGPPDSFGYRAPTEVDALDTLRLPADLDPPTDPAARATYDALLLQVTNSLADSYVSFIATNFPPSTYVEQAETWLRTVLTTGGTGINTTVETQIWARARDRAIRDADRLQQELDVTWAARRFPVPPAAYLNSSLLISKGAQDAVAEAGREQAIKSFEAEVANVRTAVDTAVRMRTLAIQSSLEYLRVTITAPQISAQTTNMLVEAEAKFAAILAEYYRAQIASAETVLRANTTNLELTRAYHAKQVDFQLENLRSFVTATVENAKMTGSMGAAALNSIHAQASISGADITNIEG
jgi:hypothetical protein